MDQPEVYVSTFEPESNILRLISWALLATVILAVGIKFTLTVANFREMYAEDIFIVLAVIFDAAFTAGITVAAPYGISNSGKIYTSDDAVIFEKAMYSTGSFLVLTLATSQISIVLFLALVTPIAEHKRWLKVIGIWLLVSNVIFFITAAFPCSAPKIWRIFDSNCTDQRANWTAFYVISLINESILISVPIHIMWARSFRTRHRMIVIASFAVRVLGTKRNKDLTSRYGNVFPSVMGTVIGSLALLNDRSNSYETILRSLGYNVARLLVVTLSIVTVCIPYIRKLMVGMQSGMIQTGRWRMGSMSARADSSRNQAEYKLGSYSQSRRDDINGDTNVSQP